MTSNTAKDLSDTIFMVLFSALIAGILISCGVAWERNYQHRVLERARFIEKERNEMKESELLKKLITMEEMHSKARAFDAIVQECQANPTKSRKWVLSLMKRNLAKTSKKTKETN